MNATWFALPKRASLMVDGEVVWFDVFAVATEVPGGIHPRVWLLTQLEGHGTLAWNRGEGFHLELTPTVTPTAPSSGVAKSRPK